MSILKNNSENSELKELKKLIGLHISEVKVDNAFMGIDSGETGRFTLTFCNGTEIVFSSSGDDVTYTYFEIKEKK